MRRWDASRTRASHASRPMPPTISVQAILPHNPKYKVLQLKAACYFQPEERSTPTRGCAPRPSPLMEGDNWIARIVDAAHQRDIAPSSWTVCCHNSELGFEHPELAMRNVFGDPYYFALCPNQPEVRNYILGLVRDLDAYGFWSLHLELLHWNQFPHHQHLKLATALDPLEFALLSMCFCDACGVRASEAGIDFEALKAARPRTYHGGLRAK